MEIRKEKFGKLLKEAVSEASRRSGISVASVLIGDGVVGSTSAFSWLYKGQVKNIARYFIAMQKIIDFLPPGRRVHYYAEIGKITLGMKFAAQPRQL